MRGSKFLGLLVVLGTTTAPAAARAAGEDRCLNNVVTAFDSIPQRVNSSQYMRVHNDNLIRSPRYTSSCRSNGCGKDNHFQGVGRYRNYLYITGSNPHDGQVADLFVARLGSASHLPESAWSVPRGNKAAYPAGDRLVRRVLVDSVNWHPGGLQVSGSTLALGTYKTGASFSKVYFYALGADPSNPRKIPEATLTVQGASTGAIGFTQLADGRYMVVAWSDSDTPPHPRRFVFYVSKTKNLKDGFSSRSNAVQLCHVANGGCKAHNPKLQGIGLVTECGTNSVYVVGSQNTSAVAPTISGTDQLFLYRASFPRGFDQQPNVEFKRYKQMWCKDKQCNLDAAGGLYVSPSNKIAYYGVYHWLISGNDRVQFNEYWGSYTGGGGRITQPARRTTPVRRKPLPGGGPGSVPPSNGRRGGRRPAPR